MQFLVANDNGNAEQDLVINGQRISAPNVFARVGKLVNLDELNPEYVLKHIHDNLIVSVKEQSTTSARMHSRAGSGAGRSPSV